MTLHHQLGISYNTAWRMRHKLTQVIMERDSEYPLVGSVQFDDVYLGRERSSGRRGLRPTRPLSWPPSRPTRRATRCT